MSEPARRIPWGFLAVCLAVLVVATCAGAVAFPQFIPGWFADEATAEMGERQRLVTEADSRARALLDATKRRQPTPQEREEAQRIRALAEEAQRLCVRLDGKRYAYLDELVGKLPD